MDISPGDSTPTSEVGGYNVIGGAESTGPVLLAAALPRLMSHPVPMPQVVTGGMRGGSDSPRGCGGVGAIPPQMAVTVANAPGPPPGGRGGEEKLKQASGTGDSAVHHGGAGLSVDVNHAGGGSGEGPPTPTHSETGQESGGSIKGELTVENNFQHGFSKPPWKFYKVSNMVAWKTS